MVNKYLGSAIGSIVFMAAVFLVYIVLSFPLTYAIGFAVAFLAYIPALYFASKMANFTEKNFTDITFLHLTAATILLAFTFFNMIFLLVVILIVAIAFVVMKTFSIRDLLKTLFMFIIVFIAATTSFQPAVAISAGQGTVLSDNWWNSLNWIRNNTETCAVVATYWDPGHFITGIAKRPVVFDGASQNALWNITAAAGLSDEEIREIAASEKFRATNVTVNGEAKTLIETARIQDIAATLSTDNETLAIKILEKYRKPGCDEVYYLATADLVGKSFWWTYFWSWNPIDKGCATPMSQMGLRQARPSTTGGITYVYEGGIPAGCNRQAPGQVIINQQNESLQAFVLRGNQLEPVEQFVYFTNQGGILRTQPNAPVKGMIFMEPNRQGVIFIPEEIKDSMFTKMFLFNGQGLERFQFVDSWGGEIKLFRIRFNNATANITMLHSLL